MRSDGHARTRALIRVRYVAIVGASVWWLAYMIGTGPVRYSGFFLPVILIAGIVVNVGLDLLDRLTQRSRLVSVLLRHQLMFDCVAANLFLGAIGSPLLFGTPVYYGGTRVLPLDISVLLSTTLVAVDTLLFQDNPPIPTLVIALAGMATAQGLALSGPGVGLLQAFQRVNRGELVSDALIVSASCFLTYAATRQIRGNLQVMDNRLAGVSRDKERMQAAFHKLSFLTAIISDMAASQAYSQVLETITDRAALFFSSDDALIATVEADTGHLKVVAAKSEYKDALFHMQIEKGVGIMGKVFEGDMPELIRNAQLDPRAVHVSGTPEEPESMMVAPLRKGSQKFGLVSVSRVGVENPFTDEDLALFTSFANIAASVLDNAMIMEALNRKNFTLTVTNRLSATFASPGSFDEEIRNVLQIMRESFQLSRINLLIVENDRFTRYFAIPAPRSATSSQEIMAGLTAGGGIVGQALRQHILVNVPDISRCADYIMVDETTRSELAVPLKGTDGRISAVLNLESAQLDFFTSDISADLLAIAGELQEFLQGRLMWEEVKEQRNIMEAINLAEVENVSISTQEQAVSHLSRLLVRIIPARSTVILLENAGNSGRPWISVRAVNREDVEPARLLESELRARTNASRSLSKAVTGLLQRRRLIIRQLDFEQRLIGFVVIGISGETILTQSEDSAFNLFMAYAQSVVQKVFLEQRSNQLTRYSAATKDLIDASFKRTDLHQFLLAAARKLQDTAGADSSAFVPFDPETRQFVVSQADLLEFAPTAGVQPSILEEAFTSASPVVVHADVGAGTVPLAPAAVTELTLRMSLEGVLYGVLYAAFNRPVIFTDEDRRMVETFVSDCSLIAENILFVHRIDELSVTDELTGLGNYRSFVARSMEQSERTVRFGEVFSLLFFDIDDFKKYNDAYSHLDGNLALQGIADILRHSIRTVDSAYRYGGEEFVILMPGASPTDARKAAERIRAAVERNSARDHRHFRSVLTLSGGVASFEDRVADAKNLLLLADLAMYQAKKGGKNAIYVLDNLAGRKSTASGTQE